MGLAALASLLIPLFLVFLAAVHDYRNVGLGAVLLSAVFFFAVLVIYLRNLLRVMARKWDLAFSIGIGTAMFVAVALVFVLLVSRNRSK